MKTSSTSSKVLLKFSQLLMYKSIVYDVKSIGSVTASYHFEASSYLKNKAKAAILTDRRRTPIGIFQNVKFVKFWVNVSAVYHFKNYSKLSNFAHSYIDALYFGFINFPRVISGAPEGSTFLVLLEYFLTQ
ncbi:Hypothetical predicted protein, partial [Mytilus galloprovincialis]